MTVLLKSLVSLGGFVGIVMPLVGVFWVFSSHCWQNCASKIL